MFIKSIGAALKSLIKYMFLSFFIVFFIVSPAFSKEEDKPILEYSIFEFYNSQKAVVDRFDKLYPDSKINGSLYDELHKIFPDMTFQKIEKEASRIRFWVKLKREIEKFFANNAAEELINSEPALAKEAYKDGYNKGDFNSIRSRNEHPEEYVKKDFKRHVPYVLDKETIKTIFSEKAKSKKKKSDKNYDNSVDKLINSISKLEIMKLPFYGISSENPVTGNLGIGKWVKNENVGIRLVSSHTAINENVEDYIFGIDFILYGTNKLFWYGNNSGGMAPKIKWEKTENIEIEKVFWPAPERFLSENNQDIIGYRKLMIPIKAKIIDKTKPVYIKANVELSSCEKNKCNYFNKSAELKLNVDSSLVTPHNIYLKLYKSTVPKIKSDKYEIEDILLEKKSDGTNQLKVKIKAKEFAKKLDVFVNSEDGLKFGRTRVSIDGDTVIARLDILNENKDILGKRLEIIARINDDVYLRKIGEVKDNGLFDLSTQGFTLAIVLAGLIGGIFLNFMPCVLPVIVLKLLSLSKYNDFEKKNPKITIVYTILGLYSSFLLLIFITYLLKIIGYSVGWGMQFQSPIFLCFMMLILAIFIANILGVFDFKTPEFINDISSKVFKNEKIEGFFAGFLLTLLATPCTAPYLGSAVAFALSQGFVEIFIIFMAIATGLSFPFWLMMIGKHDYYLNDSEAKIKNVKCFMNFMLLLTFIWIASIFYAQAGFFATIRIVLAIVFLIYIWWLSETSKIESYSVSDDGDILSRAIYNQRIKKFMNLFAILVTVIVLFSISYDSVVSFNKDHIKQEKIYKNWQKFEPEKIEKYILEGKSVFVNIGADWCLTCEFNDTTVFNFSHFKDIKESDDIVLMKADWNKFDGKVTKFMDKYGRKSIPFYIVFGNRTPGGMVLPEMLSVNKIENAIMESRYDTIYLRK
jgi:suppressor for copper-sensitivity B